MLLFGQLRERRHQAGVQPYVEHLTEPQWPIGMRDAISHSNCYRCFGYLQMRPWQAALDIAWRGERVSTSRRICRSVYLGDPLPLRRFRRCFCVLHTTHRWPVAANMRGNFVHRQTKVAHFQYSVSLYLLTAGIEIYDVFEEFPTLFQSFHW